MLLLKIRSCAVFEDSELFSVYIMGGGGGRQTVQFSVVKGT